MSRDCKKLEKAKKIFEGQNKGQNSKFLKFANFFNWFWSFEAIWVGKHIVLFLRPKKPYVHLMAFVTFKNKTIGFPIQIISNEANQLKKLPDLKHIDFFCYYWIFRRFLAYKKSRALWYSQVLNKSARMIKQFEGFPPPWLHLLHPDHVYKFLTFCPYLIPAC